MAPHGKFVDFCFAFCTSSGGQPFPTFEFPFVSLLLSFSSTMRYHYEFYEFGVHALVTPVYLVLTMRVNERRRLTQIGGDSDTAESIDFLLLMLLRMLSLKTLPRHGNSHRDCTCSNEKERIWFSVKFKEVTITLTSITFFI